MSPLSRREFVAAGVAAGAGLVVGFYLPHGGHSEKDSFSPNAYLRIAPDNKITIVVARSEMGQGVRTALPMILAEELEADWKQIEIEQAGASTLFGDQTTGGSASIRTTWDPMRKAGAAAREMLISAAAVTWGVPRSTCTAESSHIKHAATNRSLRYGELVAKASTLPIPTDVPLKQSKDYKIVGQRLARVDSPAKVKGEAVFGIDFRLPGMKYAVLSRCPTIGGKMTGFDDKESKKISGVTYVGKIGDSAVAVVADSVWGAMEGRRVLNVTWDDGPNKNLNNAAITASLKSGRVEERRESVCGGRSGKSCGTPYLRRVHSALHGPRADGAGQLHGALSGNEVRTVGSDAGSAGLPRLGRARRRTRSGPGEGQRHADGRRVRPAPGARLCGRSRAGLEGDQCSGESDLDARR